MPAHQVSWVLTGYMADGVTGIGVGEVVIPNVSGTGYVVATSANRTAAVRTTAGAGIAITAATTASRAFEIQTVGPVPPAITGLGSGVAGDIKVDADGQLVRGLAAEGELPAGKCDADGWAYLAFASAGGGDGLLPGYFDIRSFGAVASDIGDPDPFDCTDALYDAMAAAASANSLINQYGVVYIPPCGIGKEWYIAGRVNDNFGSMPHIEVSRAVRIEGVGRGRYSAGGSRVKLGPLCAGFRFVSAQGSSDGGDGSGSCISGLHIFCTPLSSTSIQRGWQSNHVYTKGDLIRPHRFHHWYFECLKDGTSTGPTPGIGDCTRYAVDDNLGSVPITPTGNRWRPAKAYSIGNKIYPNEACGRIFRCTVAGTTLGIDRGDGEAQAEFFPAAGQLIAGGEPDWFTDPNDPSGTVRATVVEQGSGVTWVADDVDPEPIWETEAATVCLADFFKPNHLYTNNAWVFGENLDRIFIAGLANPAVPQLSGATPPAGWATAKYQGEAGFVSGDDIVVAGGITWRCISPIGIVTDGTTAWASRVAGAYVFYAGGCTVEYPFVESPPNQAFTIHSIVTPTQFLASDFETIRGPGQVRLGMGLYARGGDANASRITNILFTAETEDFWSDPADHCVDDASFLGNHYEGCVVQGCGGWGFGFRGPSATGTLRGCYSEGMGRRGPKAGNVQISGAGTVAQDFFRDGTRYTNNALSGGGTGMYAEGFAGVRTTSRSDRVDGITIAANMQSGLDGVFAFRATRSVTPGTNDDTQGYGLKWGVYAGWWTMLHSEAYPAFSISGAAETTLGKGHMWLHRGFLAGQLLQRFWFGDDLSYRDSDVRTAVRNQGDYVHRADKATKGLYLGRVALGTGGRAGLNWAASSARGAGTVVSPTQGKETANNRAFLVTTGGVSGGTEPTWSDTLGASVTDGTITYEVVAGTELGVTGLVESYAEGRAIQTSVDWSDSADTDPRTAAPNVRQRGRRWQKQTTTGTANQILDDGASNSVTQLPDLTLPADSCVDVSVTLVVKRNGSADGGKITLSGTFYRNGTSNAVRIGTDDVVYKLSAGVAAVTAALVINVNQIEVQVSPGSALTLDWGIVRTHTLRTS